MSKIESIKAWRILDKLVGTGPMFCCIWYIYFIHVVDAMTVERWFQQESRMCNIYSVKARE